MSEIGNVLVKTQMAINESGKKFNEIGKEQILQYLKDSQGVRDPKQRELIYKTLTDLNLKSEANQKKEKTQSDPVVNNNDVPKKQPRKNVFGPIKRIA